MDTNFWCVTGHWEILIPTVNGESYIAQIPTFYLNGNVQGFTDVKGCIEIATRICDWDRRLQQKGFVPHFTCVKV